MGKGASASKVTRRGVSTGGQAFMQIGLLTSFGFNASMLAPGCAPPSGLQTHYISHTSDISFSST